MIALIINLSVYGLVFNLTFGFDDALVKWMPSANADTATSSVTVRNAPPSFVGFAAESPTSSSTSPVNVGGSIGFVGTSTDPEGNNVYLIVCSTGVVTAHNGGAPTCGATQYCISGSQVAGGQSSCNYSNVADPGALVETVNWNAFFCDDHASEANCSAVNQGSGDSGSPFYVNHAPTIVSASTTDNFKNPGALFTFTATTSDTDAAGSFDLLTLSVCKTNSWSTSTGCAGGTWCTATATGAATAVGISCQASTSVPWMHGASTTYAFVKDWHAMPGSNNSQSFTFTTNDVAPTIGSILLNNGNPILTNIKGAASTTVWATSTSVSDQNGCIDLVGATSTLYMSSSTLGSNCVADDNKCYKLTSSNCTISACAGGAIATVACSVQIAYHSIPTTGSGTNPYASYGWVSAISPYDGGPQSVLGTSSPVELVVNSALDVTETSIVYGTMIANTDTGATTTATTIVNFGNSPMGSDIIGTDMNKLPDVIAANNQKFGVSNVTYASLTYNLSSVTPQSVNLAIPRPTSSAVNQSSSVYWGIFVPAGRPSGNYTGTNTFSAFWDSTATAGAWN